MGFEKKKGVPLKYIKLPIIHKDGEIEEDVNHRIIARWAKCNKSIV